ncbi:MAG: NAD(P)-binding protein [Chitinophagaceae bacterium]|nr:NAD(P)-binding protein [Chitinophagaceae bacterium]MBP6214587.1 NAD(P)-binding protein [Chitinophagaceae bacterium]HQV59651.1 NAD(P)-binding protein [Chitinophagaceae bacterium]HQV85615.1 NAD(P)-binding protein [Chitinophagaceae bacterium]HQX71688.1 NAD(P)-binding protein [Chitinophagaceae bacterium]
MAATDITKAVDLSIHAEGTGPKRLRRPVYVDFMPPCNSACPAGENIQAWMAHAQSGNYFEAFQTLVEDNPFPAVMGRVCVKPCETGCNRNHIDDTVNIHAVERYIGDEAIKQKWPVQFVVNSTEKKVLVVGAGPGGLSAAYHLARMGHTVEVYDAGGHPGGLLWTGVPDYRLPKEILDAEVDRIVKMGVKIRLNYKVQDVLTEKQAGNFDAVYLSIGAQLIRKEDFQHDDSVYITDAFSFFNEVKSNTSPYVRKKVVVYGGGKLALYLARMIKRFGSEVSVYFPGDNKMMPAYDYETEDALAEGVDVQLFRSISKIEKYKMTLEKMKVEKGKAVGTGEFETTDADVLIIANRQESDSGFLRSVAGIVVNEDGTVAINAERMTGYEGIFAGGDMLPGENRSSTIAIGHGKKAAKYINGYLMQEPYQKPEKHPTASYRKLHMWYKTDAPQKEQDKLAPAVAVKSFEEVITGLSEPEARFEAQRCLSCGNCFECDGCFGACPEDAIIKLGKGNRYKFNYNACTGCAVCYEQCPCHAIEMIPEPVNSTTDVK